MPPALEPSCRLRIDVKRPDSITLVPWNMGHVDSVPGPEHKAKRPKSHKYWDLGFDGLFTHFGVETYEPWRFHSQKLISN